VEANNQRLACADAVRQGAMGTPLAEEVDTVIAAILVARFCKRSLLEICAMGGLTIDDFTNSAVYKEIFGQGRSEGLQEGREEGQRDGLERGQREGLERGRQVEAVELTLRLLQRRCGPLTPQQQARLQALPLAQLEALADALLDFHGPDDLSSWLQANEG
jgi:predicted transposase YdaD